MDSWNQIQIRSFEIDNLSVFWGKDLKKIIFDRQFCEQKKGTQQMLYMYDFLTEPVLVAPYQF